MNLWADFLTNQQRVIWKWKHYFPIYERHFRDFMYKSVTMIEIGVASGGSLQMWKRFLGPHATIIGIDILEECKAFEEDQIAIRIGPQQDTNFLQSIVEEFGAPDIVLDDGSHIVSHTLATFDFMYPKLSKNGVYMIEDLHTSYWEEYEGGYRRPGTVIERCKDLIDELNGEHTRGQLPATDFSKSTLGIHIYDSVAVFERGTTTKKWSPQIGQQ